MTAAAGHSKVTAARGLPQDLTEEVDSERASHALPLPESAGDRQLYRSPHGWQGWRCVPHAALRAKPGALRVPGCLPLQEEPAQADLCSLGYRATRGGGASGVRSGTQHPKSSVPPLSPPPSQCEAGVHPRHRRAEAERAVLSGCLSPTVEDNDQDPTETGNCRRLKKETKGAVARLQA